MSENKYKIEHANTGRANCKDVKCKKLIEKGSLRIAILAPSYYHEGTLQTNWYHYECFFNHMMRARKAKIESLDELKGFDKLPEDEQNDVRKEFEDYKDAKFGGKKKQRKGKRKKKDVDEEDVDVDIEELDEEEKPKKKRQTTRNKTTPKKKTIKRKKKEESEEESSEEGDSLPEPEEDMKDNVEEKPKPVKRPRGRPKKVVQEKKDLDEKLDILDSREQKIEEEGKIVEDQIKGKIADEMDEEGKETKDQDESKKIEDEKEGEKDLKQEEQLVKKKGEVLEDVEKNKTDDKEEVEKAQNDNKQIDSKDLITDNKVNDENKMSELYKGMDDIFDVVKTTDINFPIKEQTMEDKSGNLDKNEDKEENYEKKKEVVERMDTENRGDDKESAGTQNNRDNSSNDQMEIKMI